MKSVAVIQARMSSSRLPGKVLQDLGGKPVLDWVVQAAAAIPAINRVIVATSAEESDDPIADHCEAHGIDCLRGPLNDVLSRFVMVAESTGADTILRLTADCPFLDPWAAGLVLAEQHRTGCAFATNADCGTWPDGLDAEAVSVEALKKADSEATLGVEREHVTPFIKRDRTRFGLRNVNCPVAELGHHRWTLDTPEDLEFLRKIAKHLDPSHVPSFLEILNILRENPDIQQRELEMRNAGYAGLLPSKNASPPSFANSNERFQTVSKTIPTGSQTFSKSALQLPVPRSPLFLSHGLGGRVWDIDGNEYVDMMCGLLSVSIGYRDETVDNAIRQQLNSGISFSLPSLMEAQLAERIVDVVPSAEAVRFGKNGTDATSAAIRVARAYTGRERVIVCGYHGWQDWYIGATARSKGVPGAVAELTTAVPYNDIGAMQSAFDAHPGEIAAVIMEAATFEPPKEGYLQSVKSLAEQNGTVFVFDEIVTGFRLDLGGAQSMFGVTPDLACIGKGLGNGMPISAIVGRADLMREMEDIFFSGTFGGEALSLAAGLAVINLMQREPVIERYWDLGGRIRTGIEGAITRHGLDLCFSLKGWNPWTLTLIQDVPGTRKEATRTLFLKEMMARGVLTLGSHNVCYRHTDHDIDHTIAVYDEVLSIVASELATGALEERMDVAAIEPLFQVRKQPEKAAE